AGSSRRAARGAGCSLGRCVRARPPDAPARAPLSARRGPARVSGGAALVDSHCHVAEPEFDADRDAVLARAAASRVATLVRVGATGPAAANGPAVALAGRSGPLEIVATVGVHP